MPLDPERLHHGSVLFRMGGAISELLFLSSNRYDIELNATKFNRVKNKMLHVLPNFLFYVERNTQMGFQENNSLPGVKFGRMY